MDFVGCEGQTDLSGNNIHLRKGVKFFFKFSHLVNLRKIYTVDGSEIPRPTTWDVKIPCKQWDITISTGDRRISEPSTGTSIKDQGLFFVNDGSFALASYLTQLVSSSTMA